MSLDFGNLGDDIAAREDAGRTIHLRSATGELEYWPDGKTPITLTVVGTYSKKYREAKRTVQKRYQKRREVDVDEFTQEIAALCITAWSIPLGEGPTPLTKENALKLLQRAPWVAEQVAEAMGDHEGFSGAASPS